MTFESMFGLLQADALRPNDLRRVRGNEIHCRVDVNMTVEFARTVIERCGGALVLMSAEDRVADRGEFLIHYLFANAQANWFIDASVACPAAKPVLPSLASLTYPASRFEREIQDLFGIAFNGHPDPRRLVKHGFWPDDFHPLRKGASTGPFGDDGQPFPFTPVGGEGVYEIPVGPVHAGVIEPGHFRFSVMGETIIDMKSRLYFTHKGIEKLFEGRRAGEAVELAERISGDTTVGHALAFCQAVESGAGAEVPLRARLLRVVLLELERLYNHVGDIGAIANDTGFALAHAHALRIREQLLRINKALAGSRLLRGVLAPGGLKKDLQTSFDLPAAVDGALKDFEEIVAIALSNTLVLDRLERTGALSNALARDYGVLGYVARASGIDVDARRDHPFAAYGDLEFSVPVETSGDVKARTLIRVEELRQSVRLIRQAWGRLSPGDVSTEVGLLAPFAPTVGVVEGWRGRVVHWVAGAADGTLHRVKIVDPSFFNWPALSRALVDNIVPDFPLCNKSFNQSYSGNDL